MKKKIIIISIIIVVLAVLVMRIIPVHSGDFVIASTHAEAEKVISDTDLLIPESEYLPDDETTYYYVYENRYMFAKVKRIVISAYNQTLNIDIAPVDNDNPQMYTDTYIGSVPISVSEVSGRTTIGFFIGSLRYELELSSNEYLDYQDIYEMAESIVSQIE
ncbi:MAG: hypothetical protein R3Y65_07220 [Bacillota bacterium]